MTTTTKNLTRTMTAMRDLAQYIADRANEKLALPSDTIRYCAFLDDDSDYLPAALDMMNELMTALTDDNPDDAAAALMRRIYNDDYMITDDATCYTDLPLDLDLDLPFADELDEDDTDY